ncbi:hypothetical protein, partial [Dysgonomonas sp.]
NPNRKRIPLSPDNGKLCFGPPGINPAPQNITCPHCRSGLISSKVGNPYSNKSGGGRQKHYGRRYKGIVTIQGKHIKL